MRRRFTRRFAAAAGVAAGVTVPALLALPSAAAAPCPDVEVVFARGTNEPPGVGGIGGSFVDAVRSRVGGRSFNVYAVNYPASDDFGNPNFPKTVVDGIRDASSHIQSMANSCPRTREILGGFSQGAAVAGYVTSAAVPDGVPVASVPQPLAPDVASHIAAVALFGTPSPQFLSHLNAPPITIGAAYQPKTVQLCAPGDGICGTGNDPAAHASYGVNGMTGRAADFAVSHL
ncbi:cutinase family protein [Mycobacterium asiaticum]|uniref:Cutinase n=1 Tax=Mycobacterium asiaticum TaxID=1790 RepID=A0A1A3KGC2_MYCAS|nr:cutinase [Mycobacterium asiaticum]